MPYETKKSDSCPASKPWGVFKTADEKKMGCHSTEEKAHQQMAALYAAEEKQVSEPTFVFNINSEPSEGWLQKIKDEIANAFKAKWSTAYKNNLSDSSFLFIESGGKKDSEGKTTPRSLRHLPYRDAEGRVDLPHVRNAISRLGQSGTGKGWMSEGLRKRLLAKAQKHLQGKRSTDGNKSLHLWKEEDTGLTRFMAVFSNNYRDDDNPPEILSAEAHKDFVKAVDDGEWPYPELWNMHVKGTRYGQADLLIYDEDTGMQIALGLIDSGKEHIAHKCAELGGILSHGMPIEEIQRDLDDPTILTRYRSNELSTLPSQVAANKHTMFVLVKDQEESMNIPDEKIEALEERGVDVEALGAKLDEAQANAEEEGRESKEIPPETVEEEEVKTEEETDGEKETAPPTSAEPPVTEPTQSIPLGFDVGAMAAEIASVINESLAPVVARLDTLEGQVKELIPPQEADPALDPAKGLEDFTPAASVGALVRTMVIGTEETRVDGRKVKSEGPKETEPNLVRNGPGINFIDDMLSGKDWRDAMPSARTGG